jgi:hypothetical protein
MALRWAACLAVSLCCAMTAATASAAGSGPPAAEPFEVLPSPTQVVRSHTWAYLAMGAGAALVGSSFVFQRLADDAYDDYLVATEPDRIERLYDRSVRYDWMERSALIGGEALIATGLYLRFIRRPAASRLSLAWGPQRCALSYRF